MTEEEEESKDESRASRTEAAERRLESITSGTPVLHGSGPSGTTALPAAEPRECDPDGAASLPWVEREVLPHHGASAPIENSWVGMARSPRRRLRAGGRRRPWLAAEPPSSPGTALAAPGAWALTEQRPPVV